MDKIRLWNCIFQYNPLAINQDEKIVNVPLDYYFFNVKI